MEYCNLHSITSEGTFCKKINSLVPKGYFGMYCGSGNMEICPNFNKTNQPNVDSINDFLEKTRKVDAQISNENISSKVNETTNVKSENQNQQKSISKDDDLDNIFFMQVMGSMRM